MASPPFSLSTSTPGDSDIVSQFPLNERTLRDIIQSWILANHDTNGNHPVILMPYQSSTPATPGSSIISLYADAKGRLKYVDPAGVVNIVGVPPGAVHWTASGSTPIGYLIPDGSAVSRSTYADLFTAIGTDYGVGDGSTTFNLPDIKGRVVIGEDGSSTRIDATTFGATPVRAAVGGVKNTTLIIDNLPPITSTQTLSGLADAVTLTQANFALSPGPTGVIQNAVLRLTGTASISVTATGTLSTPISRIQPGIILRALIKV